MGVLARLFGRQQPREERRAGDVLSLGFGQWGGAGALSAREAECAATVTSCIELLAGAVSSLPAELVEDTPNGSVPVPETAPGWRILKRPNEWQSLPEFLAWCVGQLCLHGNSCAWVQDDGRGAPASILPLPWNTIAPLVIGSAEGKPRLVYDTTGSSPESSLFGIPRRLGSESVLHIRHRSDNGLIGRSPLSRAPSPIGEALAIQDVATANWRSGMRPSAVLKAPTYLQDNQRERFNESWMNKFSGALNAGRVPLLEGGWSLETASMKSVDAQFHEMRQHSVADICRLFKIPEQLLQPASRSVADLTPYISTMATLAVLPLVSAIEAAFSAAILPANQRLVLAMDGMLRGSFSQATSAICAAVQSGILTVNDGREALGWPKHPEGNAFVRGPAPDWPGDKAGMPSAAPHPGPKGDAPALPSHENTGRPKPNGSGRVLQ